MADMTTGSVDTLLTTEIQTRYLLEGVAATSVAAQVSTITTTAADSVSFPKIASATDVAWVNEGAELSTHEMSFEDVIVKPSKIGAITTVTTEAMDDAKEGGSNLGSIIVASLTGKIADGLDKAFFGALAAPAPAGLEALTGHSEVAAGTRIANTDPFIDAVAMAQDRRAEINAFVCHPDDARTLGKVKKAQASNEPLLMTSAIDGKAVRTVAGIPVITSPHVTAGHIWGIPKDRVQLVQRTNAEVKKSEDALFSSDRVMLRGTARYGFGFIDPAAVVRITLGSAEGNE